MLVMLEAILKHMGVEKEDPEVQVFEEVTRPDRMMEANQQVMGEEGKAQKARGHA